MVRTDTQAHTNFFLYFPSLITFNLKLFHFKQKKIFSRREFHFCIYTLCSAWKWNFHFQFPFFLSFVLLRKFPWHLWIFKKEILVCKCSVFIISGMFEITKHCCIQTKHILCRVIMTIKVLVKWMFAISHVPNWSILRQLHQCCYVS